MSINKMMENIFRVIKVICELIHMITEISYLIKMLLNIKMSKRVVLFFLFKSAS